jgi:hypothetical protein
MKAKELRIGNLVNGVLTQKPYIIDAWALREMESGNYQNSQDTETKVFEPIPLTEEWLLKFGFIRHHYDYANDVIYIKNIADNEIDNAEFEWGVYPNELGSGIQIKNRKSLKYVHEIQNLYFALIGEELTFKSE